MLEEEEEWGNEKLTGSKITMMTPSLFLKEKVLQQKDLNISDASWTD